MRLPPQRVPGASQEGRPCREPGGRDPPGSPLVPAPAPLAGRIGRSWSPSTDASSERSELEETRSHRPARRTPGGLRAPWSCCPRPVGVVLFLAPDALPAVFMGTLEVVEDVVMTVRDELGKSPCWDAQNARLAGRRVRHTPSTSGDAAPAGDHQECGSEEADSIDDYKRTSEVRSALSENDDRLLLSASDLINHLECAHLTRLDLEVVRGELVLEQTRTDATDLVARKGDEHERRLSRVAPGRRAGRWSRSRASPALDGLQQRRGRDARSDARGAEIIYQGVLFDGERWRGYADFLERVDEPVCPRRLELRGRGHQARPSRQALLPAPALLLLGAARAHAGRRARLDARRARHAGARELPAGRVLRLLPQRQGALRRRRSRRASTAPTPTRSSTAGCAAGRATATRVARPTTT